MIGGLEDPCVRGALIDEACLFEFGHQARPTAIFSGNLRGFFGEFSWVAKLLGRLAQLLDEFHRFVVVRRFSAFDEFFNVYPERRFVRRYLCQFFALRDFPFGFSRAFLSCWIVLARVRNSSTVRFPGVVPSGTSPTSSRNLWLSRRDNPGSEFANASKKASFSSYWYSLMFRDLGEKR